MSNMVDLETALDILGITRLEKKDIRKAYLRKALQVHPDKHKNFSSEDEEKRATADFARLHDAYCLAMEHCSHDTWVHHDDDDILMRAFRGEDVEDELRRAGVFRPDPMFGINVSVPFHATSHSRACDDAAKEKMRTYIEDILSYEEDSDYYE